MTRLFEVSKIGQICLTAALIMTTTLVPALSFAEPRQQESEAMKKLKAQDVVAQLTHRGTSKQDIQFLQKLVEQFKLSEISMTELQEQSLLRIRQGMFQLQGHMLEVGNMQAEQLWRKVLHIISISQSYEGHPWESFLTAVEKSDSAERKAAVISLGIYALDGEKVRLPAQHNGR